MTRLVRVIGVDPGSVITGYGVIDTDGVRSFHVAHGHLRVEGTSFPEKLVYILHALGEVLETWKPEEAGIEQVFFSNNAMSALKLGQARGAAICAVATRAISVAEYAPRSVKQAVVGTGAADKRQVQSMVRILLGLKESVQADAADALAVAICHAHSRQSLPTRRRSRSRTLRL